MRSDNLGGIQRLLPNVDGGQVQSSRIERHSRLHSTDPARCLCRARYDPPASESGSTSIFSLCVVSFCIFITHFSQLFHYLLEKYWGESLCSQFVDCRAN